MNNYVEEARQTMREAIGSAENLPALESMKIACLALIKTLNITERINAIEIIELVAYRDYLYKTQRQVIQDKMM